MSNLFQEHHLDECFIGNKLLFQEMKQSFLEGNIYFNLLSTFFLSGKTFYLPNSNTKSSPFIVMMLKTGKKQSVPRMTQNGELLYYIEENSSSSRIQLDRN